jgi:hypothetical protein
VAGDDLGNVAVGDGGAWSAATALTSGDAPVTAIACPKPSFCLVAVGSDLVPYEHGSWLKPRSLAGGGASAVSCTRTPLCLAIDGGILSGAGLRFRRLPAQLTGPSPAGVSCSASACVELDGAGGAVLDRRGVWSELAPLPGGRRFRPAGILTDVRARIAGTAVKVRLHCADAACRVGLSILRGKTVLGRGSRALPPNRRVTVKLALDAAGRSALRRGGRLRLALAIAEQSPTGVIRRHLAFTS